MRPGKSFLAVQPEQTGRGSIWTWIISFRSNELQPYAADVACYQQFQVRDCSGQILTTEGRIYSPPQPSEPEDGA
jgi:hypothetical protein